MRFSYATTRACEKYGIVLVACVGILFCAIADIVNPFHSKSALLYYVVNIASLVVGFWVGIIVFLRAIEWMKKHTIWASEWQRDHGARLPLAEKIAAGIPVLVALWNILIAVVLIAIVLTIIGVLCFALFKSFS